MSDTYLYSTQDLEQYLPTVWGYEARLPEGMEAPDHDMPVSERDPRSVSNRWTVQADIARAWEQAPLTLRQRQVLLLRYGFDDLMESIADTLGLSSHATVIEHHDKALSVMLSFLNGPRLELITF